MEERKIIESRHYNVKIIVILLLVTNLIGLSITTALIFDGISSSLTCRQSMYQYYLEMYSSYGAEFAKDLASSYAGTQESYIIKHFFSSKTCSDHYNIVESLTPLKTSFIIGLILWVIYFATKHYCLTVTDKRIYGKTLFGNRVELPLEHVYMVTTIPILRGVVITTTLKKKKIFLLLKNMDDVYRSLNDLVIH